MIGENYLFSLRAVAFFDKKLSCVLYPPVRRYLGCTTYNGGHYPSTFPCISSTAPRGVGGAIVIRSSLCMNYRNAELNKARRRTDGET